MFLQGLDHVIFVTALEAKLLLRQYRIALKKSGTRIPRVELQEMGPSLDLSLRRVREAPPDLMAEALKQPKMTAKKARPFPGLALLRSVPDWSLVGLAAVSR